MRSVWLFVLAEGENHTSDGAISRRALVAAARHSQSLPNQCSSK